MLAIFVDFFKMLLKIHWNSQIFRWSVLGFFPEFREIADKVNIFFTVGARQDPGDDFCKHGGLKRAIFVDSVSRWYKFFRALVEVLAVWFSRVSFFVFLGYENICCLLFFAAENYCPKVMVKWLPNEEDVLGPIIYANLNLTVAEVCNTD